MKERHHLRAHLTDQSMWGGSEYNHSVKSGKSRQSRHGMMTPVDFDVRSNASRVSKASRSSVKAKGGSSIASGLGSHANFIENSGVEIEVSASHDTELTQLHHSKPGKLLGNFKKKLSPRSNKEELLKEARRHRISAKVINEGIHNNIHHKNAHQDHNGHGKALKENKLTKGKKRKPEKHSNRVIDQKRQIRLSNVNMGTDLSDFITNQQNKLLSGFSKQAEMIKATQNKRMKALSTQMKNMMSGNSKRSNFMLIKNTESLLNRKNAKEMKMLEKQKQQQLMNQELNSGDRKEHMGRAAVHEMRKRKKASSTKVDSPFKKDREFLRVRATPGVNTGGFAHKERSSTKAKMRGAHVPRQAKKSTTNIKNKMLNGHNMAGGDSLGLKGHHKGAQPHQKRKKKISKKSSTKLSKRHLRGLEGEKKLKKDNSDTIKKPKGTRKPSDTTIKSTPKNESHEPTLKKDGHKGAKEAGNSHKNKGKKKKDYQFNHMFKIINFLENDKQLTDKREEFREKMRQLKQATYKDNKEENKKEKILEDYIIKNTIGVGSYAVVKLAIHRETREEFAIKLYDRIKMLDPIKMKNYKVTQKSNFS